MQTFIQNLASGLTLGLAICNYCSADNDNYKTISLSEDPDTTTIHYYFKNLTTEKMSVATPSKKMSDAPFPISNFDVPAKGKDEFAADFPGYFNSVEFAKATVLSETFSYVSGNKICQFTASIEVSLKNNDGDVERVPHWSGSGKSTGSEAADCSTEILEVKKSYPYSMSIEFSLE
ncbi:hypothetical protein [Pseudomonas sp. R37(2017)]|uniref:hypothetical protein n=1 Tax=Pseudomonas sp. R37(2017) TaxID=1981685 RepID=UPI000A200AF6|nr:hypothetical protein [Pseudomonas sp. R37(2017)]